MRHNFCFSTFLEKVKGEAFVFSFCWWKVLLPLQFHVSLVSHVTAAAAKLDFAMLGITALSFRDRLFFPSMELLLGLFISF